MAVVEEALDDQPRRREFPIAGRPDRTIAAAARIGSAGEPGESRAGDPNDATPGALAPAFYALNDARTPMLVSLASIGVNFAAYAMVKWAGIGHAGMALSTAGVALFGALALLALLDLRLHGPQLRKLAHSAWRIAAAAALMGWFAGCRPSPFAPRRAPAESPRSLMWRFRSPSAWPFSMPRHGFWELRNWRRCRSRVTLRLGMLPDLKLVIRLQEVDNRLADLNREISALPKHIAEIEKKLISHERKLEADRAALAANQKERKKCDGDIQTQEQKISKLKDQTLQAKTNDVYRAFQNEIEFCQKEIRKCEDRILELMTESEPLDRNVKTAEVALKTEKAQVEAEKQQARERTAVDQKASADLLKERGEIVAGITPAVYQRYTRVCKMRRGIGVAEALDGRCNLCNMSLRLQFFQELRKGDKVMACESCLRILYYNPPQAVDDVAGARAVQG
jgi:hypothetical protein